MKKFPLIHRHFVITSTYIMKDRSVYFIKEKFIKDNYRDLKSLFDKINKEKGWWKLPVAQKMEMKIRVKFGYSPNTNGRDFLMHFFRIFKQYELSKNKHAYLL